MSSFKCQQLKQAGLSEAAGCQEENICMLRQNEGSGGICMSTFYPNCYLLYLSELEDLRENRFNSVYSSVFVRLLSHKPLSHIGFAFTVEKRFLH